MIKTNNRTFPDAHPPSEKRPWNPPTMGKRRSRHFTDLAAALETGGRSSNATDAQLLKVTGARLRKRHGI